MQQKVPFSLIRCSSSKVAFCSCVEWGWHIYNIVESESDPLTRRVVDVFEKEPLKGNSEVHLHTPTKFGEDRSKDLGGDREQTDRQTNRQTDKRCSIYSMMTSLSTYNIIISTVIVNAARPTGLISHCVHRRKYNVLHLNTTFNNSWGNSSSHSNHGLQFLPHQQRMTRQLLVYQVNAFMQAK